MVTRNDVAKRAQVSPAVVSYVLNNSNYVSKEKREAVLKAIEELGYVPNTMAKGLKNKKSFQLAITRGNTLNDMFNDLMFHMEKMAYEKGYTISMLTVDVDQKTQLVTQSFIETLVSRQFDAVFIANSSMTEKQIHYLCIKGVAVVLYSTKKYTKMGKGISCLAPDYGEGIYQLIRFLMEMGHEKIAFMQNFRYPDMLNMNNYRFRGYCNAFLGSGRIINEKYICKCQSSIDDMVEEIAFMFTDWSDDERPTAIYVDETVIAGLVMRRLRELGFRIPADVSIVTSSDSTLSKILYPALTATGVDAKEMAQKVLNMMIQLIDEKKTEECFMPMQLHIRESVKNLNEK